MPTELALLPIIESAFNPQAYSSANAAGMWQFVPGTGKDFNLKQNMFKDERRGVLASTDAALSYLQKLYGMFGDWQLALAAYNWGEGNVQKAIKKNQSLGKPTDFESLADLMPAETRNYVPKLQAVKNIIANPAQYGVALPADRQRGLFHRGRQDQRHRPDHRGPAGRAVGRRIQGAQPAVQPPGHHRRRADQDPAAEGERGEVHRQPGATGAMRCRPGPRTRSPAPRKASPAWRRASAPRRK